MDDSPTKVEIPPDLDSKLDRLSTELGRSKSAVIEQALRDFVELQAWQIAAIKQGIADADAGNVVEHEAVKRWIKSWGSGNELPPPRGK